MLFTRCNIETLNAALAQANASYSNNLRLDIGRHVGTGLRAVLRAKDSRAYGARTSANGRHGPYASWEAHRDFLRALFVISPQTRVSTAMAKYTAENFEHTFPETGHKNIGSMINPVTMPQLTI
jgi:hypothetical protein